MRTRADARTGTPSGPDRTTGPRAPDQGSATVWAALLSMVVAAIALATLAFATTVLARHRAASAADLAALAAAVHADPEEAGPTPAGEAGQSGATVEVGAPCAWAGRVARGGGARLVACHCHAAVCEVRAAVATLWGSAVVAARAGPADSADPTDPEPEPLPRGLGVRPGLGVDVRKRVLDGREGGWFGMLRIRGPEPEPAARPR